MFRATEAVCKKRKDYSMLRIATILITSALASQAIAQTTQLEENVYQVESGVDFILENVGAEDFPFTWEDESGFFEQIVDPTLILSAGQTYTFKRITAAHPFRIAFETLPVEGADGAFVRTTDSGDVIDANSLQPLADFASDPAPANDPIVWTPTAADIGAYFYTFRVPTHFGMTGQILVDPKPGSLLDVVLQVNEKTGDFNTLIAAVIELDILDALLGDDALTVFAPDDHAFARLGLNEDNIAHLPEDLLAEIILYHITSGQLLAEELLEGRSTRLTMLNDGHAVVRDNRRGAFINRARLALTDVEATNGVIHVINRVLLPVFQFQR
jgi:hypothetical protein